MLFPMVWGIPRLLYSCLHWDTGPGARRVLLLVTSPCIPPPCCPQAPNCNIEDSPACGRVMSPRSICMLKTKRRKGRWETPNRTSLFFSRSVSKWRIKDTPANFWQKMIHHGSTVDTPMVNPPKLQCSHRYTRNDFLDTAGADGSRVGEGGCQSLCWTGRAAHKLLEIFCSEVCKDYVLCIWICLYQ